MSTRRARLRWSAKKWYDVYTPEYFGNKSILSVPSLSPENLIGRKVEVSLFEITGDPSHYQILVGFKIFKVEGLNAYTIFWGHEYSRDSVRSIIRRGSTKIEHVVDAVTSDNYIIRIKGLVLTRFHASHSQCTAIRKIMESSLKETISQMSLPQLAPELVMGRIDSIVHNNVKKIHSIRKTGMEKSRVIRPPPEIQAIFSGKAMVKASVET
ncbi:30S ribosomal protein S3ae [Candidatus Bathyarchaeota archaeon ex4484_205]|nr:MAG: 30S ribosomal protein S3ae [Candidatus Bathyarchaeota archaeon ex4484_205]